MQFPKSKEAKALWTTTRATIDNDSSQDHHYTKAPITAANPPRIPAPIPATLL
jgi:hypothetical protein